jgi:hypothetical protein
MDEKYLAWIRELGFAGLTFYLVVRIDKRLLKMSLILERMLEKLHLRSQEGKLDQVLEEPRRFEARK